MPADRDPFDLAELAIDAQEFMREQRRLRDSRIARINEYLMQLDGHDVELLRRYARLLHDHARLRVHIEHCQEEGSQ